MKQAIFLLTITAYIMQTGDLLKYTDAKSSLEPKRLDLSDPNTPPVGVII